GSGVVDGGRGTVGAAGSTTWGVTIGGGSKVMPCRRGAVGLQPVTRLVMLLEGAGYRATDRTHGRSPVDLMMQARCSGSVPVVTGVLGSSAGHGALVAPMSDFAVMTEQAAIFTAGPPVVKQSIGE